MHITIQVMTLVIKSNYIFYANNIILRIFFFSLFLSFSLSVCKSDRARMSAALKIFLENTEEKQRGRKILYYFLARECITRVIEGILSKTNESFKIIT